MAKNLVIVESPAKAKTIEKFLGKDYTVKSSFGHIRDLPKKGLNITSATSRGTNNLLKIGATPVTDVLDVLRALNLEPESAVKRKRKAGTPAEQMVLDLIDSGVHEGEALLQRARLLPAAFNQALTMLEINGQVRAGGANTWY